VSADQPGPASPDAVDEDVAPEPQAAAQSARVNAPRASGPRRTPRPDRVETEPALRSARPVGRPSSLPAPGFAPLDDRHDIVEDDDDDRDELADPDDEAYEFEHDREHLPSADTEATAVVGPAAADVLRPKPADPMAEDVARVPTPARRAPRRGRRVKRVLRRIDLWSVLKLALAVYACMYAAVLGSIAVLWGLLYKTGSIDKLESFLADVGLENYHFYGDRMFKACMAIGAVAVLAGTVLTVLATAIINVVSEIFGGIRVTIIEEDV
jgi:hypothetical protein